MRIKFSHFKILFFLKILVSNPIDVKGEPRARMFFLFQTDEMLMLTKIERDEVRGYA